MTEPLDQIGATILAVIPGRVRLEFTGLEVQPAPNPKGDLRVVWKAQVRGPIGLAYRRQGAQIGKDRVGVLTPDQRVVGIREGRIQQSPIPPPAFVQCRPELVCAPAAEPGVFIGREISRIDFAEGRRHRASAGIFGATAAGMAGNAVAGTYQIAAALDLIGFSPNTGTGDHQHRHHEDSPKRAHCTPPQSIGHAPGDAAAGTPWFRTGCLASQALTAPMSCASRRRAMLPMQSGAIA